MEQQCDYNEKFPDFLNNLEDYDKTNPIIFPKATKTLDYNGTVRYMVSSRIVEHINDNPSNRLNSVYLVISPRDTYDSPHSIVRLIADLGFYVFSQGKDEYIVGWTQEQRDEYSLSEKSSDDEDE